MKLEIKFILLILFLAIYNIWYGAVCWIIAGVNGLLFGSIFIVVAVFIGFYMKQTSSKTQDYMKKQSKNTSNTSHYNKNMNKIKYL